eukprot:1384703-Rhodomonas_salina.1
MQNAQPRVQFVRGMHLIPRYRVAIVLRVRQAVFGTELAYAPTRQSHYSTSYLPTQCLRTVGPEPARKVPHAAAAYK